LKNVSWFGLKKLKVGVIIVIALSLLVPVLFLVQSAPSLELQWGEVYANWTASSIVRVQDGGFVVAIDNYTDSSIGPSLMKINNDGGVEWIKTCPGIKGWTTLQVVDSGYVLSTGKGWLKTDFQGNIEWSKQFYLPHDRASIPCVFLEEEDSYVMFESGYSVGRNYYSINKYGADDVLLWTKYIGEANIRTFLRPDSGDGYFVAGGRDQKGWFTKFDLEGEVVWSRTYKYKTSGEEGLFFDLVIQTSDGGFLLSGRDDGASWVVKTDSKGREQWHKSYDRYVILGDDILYNYDCRVAGVVQDQNGRYLVFRGMDMIVLGSRGNELGVIPYFKSAGEFEGLGFVKVNIVSGIVDNNGLVVAVTYQTAPHPDTYLDLLDGPYSLWVANFTLEPTPTSDSNVLLFGVVTLVVGVVFVGFLVYLRKRMFRR